MIGIESRVNGRWYSMRSVLTVGTFDLTHYGHYKLFENCSHIAGFGGEVIVGVNTDEFIEKYKGKRPVLTYEERVKNIISCKYVDDVIENYSGETLAPLLEDIEPDFLVVGSDWASKDYYKQIGVTQEWLEDRRIVLVYVPYTTLISSTEIKRRLNEN